MNDFVEITRYNFSDWLDKTNGYTVASMVFKQQAKVNLFSRESLQVISNALEKPWNHPELLIPALNEVLFGSMSLWEVQEGGSPWVSCQECVYDWLQEIGETDAKYGENYQNDSKGIYVSVDFFHQLTEEFQHSCLGCGVELI